MVQGGGVEYLHTYIIRIGVDIYGPCLNHNNILNDQGCSLYFDGLNVPYALGCCDIYIGSIHNYYMFIYNFLNKL